MNYKILKMTEFLDFNQENEFDIVKFGKILNLFIRSIVINGMAYYMGQ